MLATGVWVRMLANRGTVQNVSDVAVGDVGDVGEQGYWLECWRRWRTRVLVRMLATEQGFWLECWRRWRRWRTGVLVRMLATLATLANRGTVQNVGDVGDVGEPGSGNDDLDFSNWFSFDITPHGEIMRVYHPANEHTDVLTAKKGFVSLLAAKLHYDKENEQSSTEWSYKTEEFGNEGHHNATYSVIRTPTGIEFKKTRQSTPIPNAKGRHMKYDKTAHSDKTIKELKGIIKDSVDCIRDEPEQGSRKVLTCFHELVEALGSLPDEELNNIAKGYFIVLKPV
ncbi:Hypothetical predicted protein, partial [Mytilus galloprovincialis]